MEQTEVLGTCLDQSETATASNAFPTHIVWFTFGGHETKTRANVLSNVQIGATEVEGWWLYASDIIVIAL